MHYLTQGICKYVYHGKIEYIEIAGFRKKSKFNNVLSYVTINVYTLGLLDSSNKTKDLDLDLPQSAHVTLYVILYISSNKHKMLFTQ